MELWGGGGGNWFECKGQGTSLLQVQYSILYVAAWTTVGEERGSRGQLSHRRTCVCLYFPAEK